MKWAATLKPNGTFINARALAVPEDDPGHGSRRNSEDCLLSHQRQLEISLLTLRVGVAIVMLVWSVDKLLRPEHAAGVFAAFYRMPGLGEPVFYVAGVAQLIVVALFLLGVLRTASYGAILAMHAVSTFSSFKQYLNPFEGPNILFFAAWPMLAACIALFLLRDSDTLLSLGKRVTPLPG